MASVVLKPHREESLLKGHHWIFSGAIDKIPEQPKGALLPVYSSKGELLAHAFFNTATGTIWGRVLSFGPEEPLKVLKRVIEQAVERRKFFVKTPETDSYRLIHGEGDRLSGLIVDQYGDDLIVQIHTLGMERIKDKIVDLLVKQLAPKGILEKSSGPSRREEGLQDKLEVLFGEVPKELVMTENGHRFYVDPYQGQKTGFFLDQRELRLWLKEHIGGRSLLNTFSYTGGFTVYGLQGGAEMAVSLDASAKAMATVERNLSLNNLQDKPHTSVVADAFIYLKEKPLPFQAIVLDPPALIKKKNDFQAGCRGYYEINRQVLEKIPPKSLLISCSCSHFMKEGIFLKIIQDAARRAGREITLLHQHTIQPDHPLNPAHPESDYLKGFAFFVN